MNKVKRFPLIELESIGDDDNTGDDEKDTKLSLKPARKLVGDPIEIGNDGDMELTNEVEDGPEASFEMRVAFGRLPVIY